MVVVSDASDARREGSDPLDGSLLLLDRERREHGQRDNFGGSGGSAMEVAGFVAKGVVSRLHAQGDQRMNAGSDAGGVEEADETIPVAGADDVDMAVGAGTFRFIGENDDTDAAEQRVVLGGALAAADVPVFQVWQFAAQNRALNDIESAVVALDLVVSLLGLPWSRSNLNLPASTESLVVMHWPHRTRRDTIPDRS